MKNLSIKYLILLLSLNCTSSVSGQIINFPFDSNLDDTVNGYTPSTLGNPSIINDDGNQVLQLEGDEVLIMPDAVHESINPDEDLEIQIRFKITDTYADSPYDATGEFGLNARRILITNKSFSTYNLGFEVFVEEMDEEYRVLFSFGDDTFEGSTFIYTEVIEENTWVDLKLIFRLNQENPSIVFKLNGYYNYYPLNYLDISIFKESLNTQQIWIGTDAGNFQDIEDFAFAETSIDYLKIYNPVAVGNSAQVASALALMTNHVNGTNPLTVAEQRTELTSIVNNWDDNTYSAISADILNYISTYEEEEGTVYEFYGEYFNHRLVAIPRALQFMLMTYLIDNVYTSSNVTNMSGVSFLDHEIMPGPVATNAPRLSGSVAIDGDYNTDPGFYLNTPSLVVRPTGYYAAPGEIVDITVPSSIVNQGVKVHVGAHYADYREDNKGYRRMPNIATKFNLDAANISVANPFGGAIFFVFPDGSNFGSTTVEINNAVKAPYFSTKTGYSNSLSDYQTDVNNGYVNWVDIESDNFLCTFPQVLASAYPDASAILTPLNDMIGKFNILAGRPLDKIRSEYIIIEPQSYNEVTYPASYPMSVPNGNLDEALADAFPVSVLDPQIYMSSYDGTTVLHELGHLHNFPTMWDEGETNVDLPNVIAFNTVFGVNIDTALYYATYFQNLDGDQAALDWMLDSKFRDGELTEFDDVSYQARGMAKYVDVARLFSWDTLGLIHNHWYTEAINAGVVQDGMEVVSPGEYIEVASNQLGFNFAPLWEMWGKLPSQSLIDQLDSYPDENRIRDRILYYRSLVPANATEFQTVYNDITPNIEDHHKERYDDMLNFYDETTAAAIYERIDDILCTYFDVNCESVNSDKQAVAIKVFLEGPYIGGSMSNNLQILNFLPNAQPYDTTPWNYNGSETLPNYNNMVDWILVEARSGNNGDTLIETVAGVLTTNGDILDVDGSGSGPKFSNLISGTNYFFAVKHRNHMAIMTLNAENPELAIDLSDVNNISAASNSCVNLGDGNCGLFAGDFNGNNVFTVLDFNNWVSNSSEIFEYHANDANLDGLNTVADYNLYRMNNSRLSISVLQYP